MRRILVGLCVWVALLPVLRAEDPKPIKALLVIGGCCHDYKKQKEALKRGIEDRAHVIVDIDFSEDKSTKATFERYRKADWAKGYDVIIHDECSADVKDKDYVASILRVHEEGKPAVNLHCAFHSYRTGADDWFRFCGIQSSAHGLRKPIDVTFNEAKHPILTGSQDWKTIDEELYNNIKVFPTAQILATGTQVVPVKKGTSDTRTDKAAVIWTNTYGKAKVFNTTLGHENATVEDPRYLKIVTRGLLWACDKLEDKYLKPERQEMPKK